MKRLITGGAACALALMLSVSAFAMEVPTSTVVQNLNGVQQYIKTYTVSVALDPLELIEEPFEYEGCVYTFADITKHENDFQAQKTIQLESVDWQVQGTALVDDVLVPSSYVAVATYAGKASYSTPIGYITTADYVGTVSCEEVKDITYTVLYVGAEGSLTDEDAPVRSQPSALDVVAANKTQFIIGGGIALLLISVGVCLLLRARRQGIEVDTEYDEAAETEATEHETDK